MSSTTASATGPRNPRIARARWVLLLPLYLAAAVAGGWLAYGFGFRASGGSLLWGLVAGANGAVFSSMLVDAVSARLSRRRR